MPVAVIPFVMGLGACGQQGAHPLLGGAPPVAARSIAAPAIEDGGTALAPQGWLDFCARGGTDPSCSAALFTPARAMQLQQIQAKSRKIPRRTDRQLYGVAEFWHIADQQTGGDCEDIALAAREQLIALGWPLSALRLATAWTERNAYHLVLTVDILVNDAVQTLVVDSRFPTVQSYGALVGLGYRFETRQAAIGAGWVAIQALSPSRTVTAQRRNPVWSSATAAIERSGHFPAPVLSSGTPAPIATASGPDTAPTMAGGTMPIALAATPVAGFGASQAFFPSDQPLGEGPRFGFPWYVQ